MSDYDGAWKAALDVYLQEFLELCFPTIHTAIDWSRPYRFLETELQRASSAAYRGRRTVDKLVEVWGRDGVATWVLIHIEIQSQNQADFALRMFQYVRGYTQVCIASAGGWYGREGTRDTHATWRGNPKGKTASWESGYRPSHTGPMLCKSRVLWRKLDCLNPNPDGV
jgi:hypothetical protein